MHHSILDIFSLYNTTWFNTCTATLAIVKDAVWCLIIQSRYLIAIEILKNHVWLSVFSTVPVNTEDIRRHSDQQILFQYVDKIHIWKVNTLRLRQNGCHFTDDIFKGIFLYENVWIPIKFSLKFVPKGPNNNITALVQIRAWRLPGDKPLSEPMIVSLPAHICITQPQWVKGHPLRVIFWPMPKTLTVYKHIQGRHARIENFKSN